MPATHNRMNIVLNEAPRIATVGFIIGSQCHGMLSVLQRQTLSWSAMSFKYTVSNQGMFMGTILKDLAFPSSRLHSLQRRRAQDEGA